MRGAELRYCLVVLGLCLLERYLAVAWIEFHEQRSAFDALIIFNVDCLDGAINARRNGIQVTIDLCVVCVFESTGVEIPSGASREQYERDYPDKIGVHPTARLYRLCRVGPKLAVRKSRRGNLSFCFHVQDH